MIPPNSYTFEYPISASFFAASLLLRPLLQSRQRALRGLNDYERKGRLIRFAMGRGFTMDIIRQCLDIDDDDVVVEDDDFYGGGMCTSSS